MRSALIDLGTNSVRLHIFEQDEKGRLRRIFQRKDMIQLGVGLFSTGDFTEKARTAALTVFNEFRENLESFKVSKTHAVATCAMREASNGKALRDEIEQHTGIALQIISGAEEAALIAEGIIKELGPFDKKTLLVDIGGGSTELSYVKGSDVLFATSTRLGAVRCQEVNLRKIPAEKKDEKALREHIRNTIDEHLVSFDSPSAKRIIGSSGSIRAIVRLIRGSTSDEAACSAEELSKFAKGLRGKEVEKILAYKTLEPKRARIIFSATVILDEIAQHLGVREIRAVPLGLKDGLLQRLKRNLSEAAKPTKS